MRAAGIAALCIAVAVVYYPAAGHDFISLDDGATITRNPAVRQGLAPETVRWAFGIAGRANWHPLTWLAHMANVSLFGLEPAGHHLAAVLCHALAAASCLLALVRLTGSFYPSAFTAALFALHPLRVESVAWAAELKDPLSGLFFFLTLLAYAGYARRPTLPRYLAVAAAAALGLMSKPMLVTLPFVLLLLDAWPLGRVRLPPGRPAQRPRLVLLEKVPLLAMSAAVAALTWKAQAGQGAIVASEVIPPAARAANALIAAVAYLRELLWPARLSVFYPHPKSGVSLALAAAAGFLLAGVGALAVAHVRRRPWLALGWAWYLGTLVPVLGLVQAGGQARADRYTYLPLVGVGVMLAWTAGELSARRQRHRLALAAVAAGVLLAAAVAARAELRWWRDSVTLFGRSCTVQPQGNLLALYHLGLALSEERRAGKRPPFEGADAAGSDLMVRAHLQAALILASQGRIPEAKTQVEDALRVAPAEPAALALREALARSPLSFVRDPAPAQTAPGSARDQFWRAGALAAMGDRDGALASYREALRLEPEFAEAWLNLGVLLGEMGRHEEAARCFERALLLRPGWAQAAGNLELARRQRRPR